MSDYKFWFISALLVFPMIVSAQKLANYNDVLNKKVLGHITTYTSKSEEKFTIGDSITLGSPFRNDYFDYIKQNGGLELFPLPSTASGSRVVIKRMISRSKFLRVVTTSANGFVYELEIYNLEGALQNGEIVSSKLSSDEALAELKRWKDKLDLGLITESEYELKKAELAKLID